MHASEDGGRPPNTLTIPIGDYNKFVEYTHAWKDICEKLQQEKCADESRITEKEDEILYLEEEKFAKRQCCKNVRCTSK